MKTKEQFKVGKNNISYIGYNFNNWFGEMELDSEKILTHSKILEKDMNDEEILKELKPKEVKIGDVLATLDTLNKNEVNIFYVKDYEGVLHTVYAHWYDDGWYVNAVSVSNPNAWHAGSRIFSAIPFDTQNQTLSPSDTMTLERAIGVCVMNGYTVTKTK